MGGTVVSAFDAVALIVGIFFVVGIAVGFLAVISIPALGRARPSWRQPGDRFDPGPRDPPDSGAPTEPLPYREPDDRDDYPWWPSQR